MTTCVLCSCTITLNNTVHYEQFSKSPMLKFRFFILTLVIARVIKRLSIHKPLLLFNSIYSYELYNIYNFTVFTTCTLYQCVGVFWRLTSCPRPVAPVPRLTLGGKHCPTSHEGWAYSFTNHKHVLTYTSQLHKYNVDSGDSVVAVYHVLQYIYKY